MINECYISEDVMTTLVVIFMIAATVIVISVSLFTLFVPLKRTDVQTGKWQHLAYLMGIAFFCMVLALGGLVDAVLFKHCPSIGSSALIVLVSLAVGVFSESHFRRFLFDKARADEFLVKLKDVAENKSSLSNQEGFPFQEIPDRSGRSKGIFIFLAMNFVPVAVVGLACYLLIVGLPWFNHWVSVILALLLLATNYAGHYYLKRKSVEFADKFLEEHNSSSNGG